MSVKSIKRLIKGVPGSDGAGVSLNRVLSGNTVTDFDPFLMLDIFDSKDPKDFINGFPMHPHRGIETITYLIEGEIDHEDSLGNKGKIFGGESQWMTAGSGILHEEMPQEVEHMYGFQLWLNLAKKNKMTKPAYFDIKDDMIGEYKTDDMTVKVISGEYEGVKGAKPKYIQAKILDITLKQDKNFVVDVAEGETAFIFTMSGEIKTGGQGGEEGQQIEEKTAILYGDGEAVSATAADGDSRFFYYSGMPLKEPIAWGGPIVMNTKEEIRTAFSELNNDTFIK